MRVNRLRRGVAAAHARGVCDGGRVAHELEPGADPEQRLRRVGISARLVGETVARASSPGSAFGAFERSPSHRLTLLERSFTDAGIGKVTDAQGRSCVVVLLAAWPRYPALERRAAIAADPNAARYSDSAAVATDSS